MSHAGGNPYESPMGASGHIAAMAEQSERVTFIQRTYGHLAVAILAFVLIEAAIFLTVPAETLAGTVAIFGGWTWLLFLGGFMAVSWIARSWAESDTSRSTQYLGLGLYVIAQALFFVPLLFLAQHFTRGNVIEAAGIITLVIFGGLTAIVYLTGTDFSFMRMFLIWGGLIGIGLIVCGLIFGLNLGVWFSVAMIALASGYILYDTSNVLHHYRTDQYVAASLALFASVALLFWYVLQLLMALSGRD